MRRFVIGDIHGAYKALEQCFDRSGFDRENDLLISLGDICDGWPDTDKAFDELLTVRNLIYILGNHDQWLLNWFNTGASPQTWLSQGGTATLKSMTGREYQAYKQLLETGHSYFILEERLFVHGGILTDRPVEQQDTDIFLWDRSLIRKVIGQMENGINEQLTPFKMVYLGHTPTINFGPPEPIIHSGVCMLDTGAGWPGGKLTLMNIDSGETFFSDYVDKLYHGIRSR